METDSERKEREISEKLDAHCFKCSERLVLKGAYFECPEHGRGWMPTLTNFAERK